jgi:hypothetical protein
MGKDSDPKDSGIKFEFIEPIRPRSAAVPSPPPAKPRDTSFQIGGVISPPSTSVEQLEAPEMLNNSRERSEQHVEQSPERLVHIGLRIPTSMLAEIDAVALTTHDSMSEVIRRLLRGALAAKKGS